jgi:hypothetical protein
MAWIMLQSPRRIKQRRQMQEAGTFTQSFMLCCATAPRDWLTLTTRFLLKYVSRDTVELLGKGTGGVPEVQKVIAGYEEKSPLYGLVQYRRKKVILKYVPDGTSRLLQGESDDMHAHCWQNVN